MAIVKIETWKCSDGKEFATRSEAQGHEKWLEVTHFVNIHLHFQNVFDEKMYGDAIAEFIIEKQDDLAEIFGWKG